METTNLRIGQLDQKVEGLSEKLAEMDTATATQFAETRELIQDRFTLLQQRLEKVDGDIRTDMHEGFRRVRTEMKDGFADVRTEFATVRTEMKDGFDRMERKLDRVLGTRPRRTRGRRRR